MVPGEIRIVRQIGKKVLCIEYCDRECLVPRVEGAGDWTGIHSSLNETYTHRFYCLDDIVLLHSEHSPMLIYEFVPEYRGTGKDRFLYDVVFRYSALEWDMVTQDWEKNSRMRSWHNGRYHWPDAGFASIRELLAEGVEKYSYVKVERASRLFNF